jgi:hypothetical protein
MFSDLGLENGYRDTNDTVLFCKIIPTYPTFTCSSINYSSFHVLLKGLLLLKFQVNEN